MYIANPSILGKCAVKVLSKLTENLYENSSSNLINIKKDNHNGLSFFGVMMDIAGLFEKISVMSFCTL